MKGKSSRNGRITEQPSFLLQATRYASTRFVGTEANISVLEALFDYYRQLPGQPRVWYGHPLVSDPVEFYSKPVFVDGKRTEYWPRCYDLRNNLKDGGCSYSSFVGILDDPQEPYGVKEGWDTEISARWGNSETRYYRFGRDFLTIDFLPFSNLIERSSFLDIIHHVYVLWRADIVGIVDLKSPMPKKSNNWDAEWLDKMLIGIVDDELFIRPELDEYFESRENSGKA